MTICLGAICAGPTGTRAEAVVVASDRMVTMGGLQEFEHEVPKFNRLGDRVIGLTAGDALRGRELLNAIRATGTAAIGSVRAVADAAAKHYADLRRAHVDATVFGPRGITIQDFYSGLQSKLLPQLVGGLDQQVANFDFGVEILIAGVDDEGAHLFQVGNPGGKVLDFAPIGFGAIGSGGLHAIQAMIGVAHAPARELNDTIYRAFAAKRRAEVAPGVGHDTDLLVITDGGIQELSSDAIATLQMIYDGYTQPVKAELESQVRAARFLEDGHDMATRPGE